MFSVLKVIFFSIRVESLAFSAVLFLFSPLSFAKIHIEPYVGWSLTYTSTKPLSKESLSGDPGKSIQLLKEGRYYSGPTPGMRLGYSSLGLAVGLDFTYGHWISFFKENFTPFRNEETLRPVLLGLFASYKLPLLLRVYATVIPHTVVNFKSGTEPESTYCKKSRGGKIGLSWLSLPFLSVNFEYLPLYIGGEDCGYWSHTGTVYANFTF